MMLPSSIWITLFFILSTISLACVATTITMNSDRQKILTDYISYIYTTGRTYDTVGKYIKHVTDFLEVTKEVKPCLRGNSNNI